MTARDAKPSDSVAHRRARRDQLVTELVHPIQQTRWTARTDSGGRVWTVYDEHTTARLIAHPRRCSVADSSTGGLFTTARPRLLARGSARISVLGLVASYLLGPIDNAGNYAAPVGGTGPRATQLRDHTGITIAAADVTTVSGGLSIELLPSGPLNNRALARYLDPAHLRTLRAMNPLSYHTHPNGSDGVLDDHTGAVHARICTRDPDLWSIQLEANQLPTPWLIALLTLARPITTR